MFLVDGIQRESRSSFYAWNLVVRIDFDAQTEIGHSCMKLGTNHFDVFPAYRICFKDSCRKWKL